MGCYIQTDSNKGKADFLIRLFGAVKLPHPEYHSQGYTAICVVDNGLFEAAGVMFDKAEVQAFSDPNDYRPKTWLKMPTQTLLDICPLAAKYLPAAELPASTEGN